MSRVKIAVLKTGYCPELELRAVPEPPRSVNVPDQMPQKQGLTLKICFIMLLSGPKSKENRGEHPCRTRSLSKARERTT